MAFLEICTFRDHDCKVIFREEVSFQQSNTRNKLPLKFDIKLFVFIVCYTLRAGYLVVSEISVFIFLFEQNTILFVRRHGAEHWFLHEEKQNRVSILFYDFFSKLMIFTKKKLIQQPKNQCSSYPGCTKCNFCDNTCKVIQSRSVFLAVKMYQITNLH